MVNAIIALCAILIGIVGTYFYMKDKTVIATSIGAKFDLYWKVFGFFFVIGGITGIIVLVFLKEFGVYIALGLGAITILFAVRGNKEVDAEARQKQYNLAGIFLFAALGVAFLTFTLDNNKKVEDKPPAVHHTTTTPREKPKEKYPPELEKNAFDGEKYGFSELSTEEQNEANGLKNSGKTDDFVVKWLHNVRVVRGGVPLGKKIKPIPSGRKLDSDDLRLGYIAIDEDVDSFSKKLGEPDHIKETNDAKVYSYGNAKFPSIEITVKNSSVDMIVSLAAGINTPRGITSSNKLTGGIIDIRASTLSNVIEAYGSEYKKSQYEDLNLYEYTITSRQGQPCILRFAVGQDDNKVHYISIRHVSEDNKSASQTVDNSDKGTLVGNLRGENFYVKSGSVVRVGDSHPDAAPEFKCVLVNDSGQEMNCEFKARGIVVMFVEGQRFSDSSSEPNVEALYNAIVEKFLRP